MIYQDIMASVAEGQAEQTLELTKRALAQGYPAQSVLDKGLIAGMNNVAEKYREERVMVPDVLMATRAMHAGMSIIKPHLKAPHKKGYGLVVIGTVAGDLHDIGKNLVKMMVMSTGVRVIDLGVDVTPKEFARAVRNEKPVILMISALLTTTMPVMKDVIDELEATGLRKGLKIIIGGAPIDDNFAKEIGADYYFESALDVKYFLEDNINKIASKKSR